MTFVLATPRILLRELLPDDIAFVSRLLADPEVMHHYPRPLSRAEARDWIEGQRVRYEMDGHGLWLAQLRETGEPIGQVGLVMQSLEMLAGERRAEVAWLLERKHWGKGYATEAAFAVRDDALGERGYPCVISLVRPDNTRSRAVAERLGMKVAGRTIHSGLPHEVYAIGELDAPLASSGTRGT